MTPTHPAQTAAAMARFESRARHREVEARLDALRHAGYNTVVLPILRGGELLVKWRRGKPGGLGVAALETAARQRDLSLWAYLDPLSASPRGAKGIGSLARQHPEWLMRNTRGRIRPMGENVAEPVFAWTNLDFRRRVADALVAMADSQPLSGVVLDFRRFPVPGDDPGRWFCCSFASQRRATEALGIDFEQMLCEGSREQIRAWHAWTMGEARAFVEALVSRVSAVRRDVSFKIMVADDGCLPVERFPAIQCFLDGLVHELIIEWASPETDLSLVMEKLDAADAESRMILPAVGSLDDVEARRRVLSRLPMPGFLVMRPSGDGEKVPALTETPWRGHGALEDQPLLAAGQLAGHVADQLGAESKLGRVCARLRDYLDTFEPEPVSLSQLITNIRNVERRIAQGDYPLPAEKNHLLRDVGLASRLLTMVRARPVMV